MLGDLAFGLDAIGSHTSTLVEAFEGSIGGSAAAWTVTTTLEVDADAAARSLTVTITGSLPEGYAEAGITRCLFYAPPAPAETVLPLLRQWAEIAKRAPA